MKVRNLNTFKTIVETKSRKFSSDIISLRSNALKKFDITQVKQMEDDTVTQVDEFDNVIGPLSKIDAHLRPLLEINRVPHRAFSLFLFNDKNELLL